jgi:peptide/nickel transport system substrate-binding protein
MKFFYHYCTLCITIFMVCLAGLSTSAGAQTLRWAIASDALSLDPHAQNESLTNSINAHLYERLTARDENLRIVAGLARQWRQRSATEWEFDLQPGVVFHDGTPLSADDVVFSIQRAQHPNSGVSQFANRLGKAAAVDALRVRLLLERPNPVLLDHVDSIPIMSRAWARTHGALMPISLKDQDPGFARMHAMGTGPFQLVSRQPDQRTVFERFPRYWRAVPGNVQRLEIVPIANALSRMSALLNGTVDILTQVPPRDLERLASNPDIRLSQARENRVLYFGFDQYRPELLYGKSDLGNPLKSLNVRQAMAMAIDTQALAQSIWRGKAQPTNCLLPSFALCERLLGPERVMAPHDLQQARALLTKAGYPDGFSVTLDCPSDRHPNDEALCVAVAAMLAKVKVQVRVNLQPRSLYYVKLDQFDSSFYLMGWGGADADAQTTLEPIYHSFQSIDGLGNMNYGRFSNPSLDALITSTGAMPAGVARDRLVKQAIDLHNQNLYHLPLLRQQVTWATRRNVEAKPAPNNHMTAWRVRVQPLN